uniref:benzoate/H(+) symporter BenE family transporter n=1 Tax=Aquiluna sp. TaxID=2053504 RepID=UPI004048E4F6
MSKSQTLAPFLAGSVASTTGSIATFGIAIAGLSAMGASSSQIATALFVMLIGYGVLSIGLSVHLKMPVSIVWSTPGAAFLATSAGLGLSFELAVGAFIFSSLLIVLTGASPALGRLVARIPPQISAAMLAGVIFPFVAATVTASVGYPILVLPVIVLWLLINRVLPLWASPVSIAVGFILIGLSPEASDYKLDGFWPDLAQLVPGFDVGAILAIGVPLYLVTMASQNLPGLAIMNGLGYQLPTRKVFVSTGLGSVLTGFFGGFGLNLAAITAALNADEGAAKDPSRRWIAASWGGVVYILFALFAAPFAAFVLAVPTDLLLALAGIALINTFASSIKTAVSEDSTRLAGVVTFVIGAAGITVLGIGGAFWALVSGILVWLIQKKR